ncbi:MAG: hypothetical protein ACI9G1_004221 [Pirellulaceae bacterium]|jgi:hypothetical protein
MDFEDRLRKAVQRGQDTSRAKAEEAKGDALSDEELKRLHSQYRLQLSDRIEECVAKLVNFFPGFEVKIIYGDRGWGAACTRDDLRLDRGRRGNDFSRFEMTVRPFSSSLVLDLTAKGTVRNKEAFNRTHYEKLSEVDPSRFLEMIDKWVLQYAEVFSASNS